MLEPVGFYNEKILYYKVIMFLNLLQGRKKLVPSKVLGKSLCPNCGYNERGLTKENVHETPINQTYWKSMVMKVWPKYRSSLWFLAAYEKTSS